MSAFDYADMQATAAELIAEFGLIGSVISITAPDPLAGGDPVEVSAPATLVPMKYDARQIDGTVILAGDVQIYVSAVGLSFPPEVGMHLMCGGKRYRIVNMDPYNFNGQTDVVYVCQARIAQ